MNGIGFELCVPYLHPSAQSGTRIQLAIILAEDEMIAPRNTDDVASFRCSHSNSNPETLAG
jgi:hypothetical protein